MRALQDLIEMVLCAPNVVAAQQVLLLVADPFTAAIPLVLDTILLAQLELLQGNPDLMLVVPQVPHTVVVKPLEQRP